MNPTLNIPGCIEALRKAVELLQVATDQAPERHRFLIGPLVDATSNLADFIEDFPGTGT